MKLNMIIGVDLDGDAFCDPETGQLAPGPELGRILHDIADRIVTQVPADAKLFDINGNVCGHITTQKYD